jgi:REP element-mobilizing transposase RayT
MDSQTGFNFEHRRLWIVDRIKLLCSVFAVNLCAYAVMSNHYHVVVRINTDEINRWSDQEVARRWVKIFSGPLLIHQYLGNTNLTTTELGQVSDLLAIWRERLGNLSWFMRCLNEPIARMANHEDQCTGRFWEGRFRSQALLDTRAVLACMAYVDLNPIRAALAKTPEQSDYTSIQERIRHPNNSWLIPFDDESEDDTGIPFGLKDYLKLVDWGGREVKHNKPGYIPKNTPSILARLRMDAAPVLGYLGKTDQTTFAALGPVSKLREFALSVGQCFVKGQSLGKKICPDFS